MPYPLMFFTSRTPIIDGQTHCAYSRYLGYHAGPHGTGWRLKQTAVPLATGAAVHTGLDLLGQWIKDADTAPSREVIAWAATEAAAGYEHKARLKGLQVGLGDLAAGQETLILEQRTLIEGLIWVWALVRLPALLDTHRVIGVEDEETIILDCTCGLGEALWDWRLHYQRGCHGIVQQGRADWLVESRETGAVTYIEFKTKAYPNAGWEQAWEHSGQLLVNMEAASRRLGKAVSEAQVHVLYKGKRDKPKTAGPDVPKTQQSSLCYGVYEPSGFNGGQWRPRMEREYWSKTVPIWDLERPLIPIRDGASRVESWVSAHLASFGGLIHVLGPFPRPAALVPKAIRSIQASERQWRIAIEDIRNGADPADLIDRSWQCTGFDGTSCAFMPICFDQPDAMERYEIRTPHHQPEKDVFEQVGIVFPEELSDEY